MILAIVIFLLVYAFIVTEKIHRTIIALFGAGILLVFKIVSYEYAIHHAIDFNTLGLLIGMMIIVFITKRTGIFEYIAVKQVKLSKGNLIVMMILLSVVTAVASAFLDNVTTVLLIIPIVLSITEDLNISPLPFAISIIFASNVGGTATLIGDPPNIMIGSKAGLSFMDFVNNLTPAIFIILIITVLIFALIFKKQLKVDEELKEFFLKIDESEYIKDKKLLVKSLFVLGLTIVGFILHDKLKLESSTIALFGASFLLLISGVDVKEVLEEVEWTTIFFFIGLFIIVGGLEITGVIDILAKAMLNITHNNPLLTTIVILWGSAIFSAFVDNIPFTATMIPLILEMQKLGHLDVQPLWWALSLGACLGGNGTIIGASANVVTSGLLEEKGYRLSFGEFFKYAFPTMILTIILSTVYLVIRCYM
ncbi:Citrate transporter [Caldicellulosiruptor obsidiansis OB47]|uniref:Citrate transporter n=1 Tax=Caldicellulosiruptor obsidiansis (strain ATCC BAA-2073 / JCM 16842 / OB47) TaxID=608506 RepID=D9TFX4_CALOO|nr:ArsB/NhaD family transporter [Caldicellulosiruptor obsidiansis]ADL43094.1 Citrate transporter [Caldicellulosiruptor obsidiansis OB47]